MRRLILRPGAIGDFIVSLPALEHLRAPYTEVWTTEANRVLARFDDGAAALVERRLGAGRVLAWPTSLDGSWSDLALKPVFLPFVRQAATFLAGFQSNAAWQSAGRALDLTAKVQAASENGFLVATSATPLTISAGLQTTLVIDDPAQRVAAVGDDPIPDLLDQRPPPDPL